jgi:hypothetical protein
MSVVPNSWLLSRLKITRMCKVESTFMRGHYFEVGRTGELFSRSQYAGILGQEGAELVCRFFPLSD